MKTFVRNCVSCQQHKFNRHTKSPVERINAPASRFQTVHIDIVGPLPVAYVGDSNNMLPYKHILKCIDRATRWIERIR